LLVAIAFDPPLPPGEGVVADRLWGTASRSDWAPAVLQRTGLGWGFGV